MSSILDALNRLEEEKEQARRAAEEGGIDPEEAARELLGMPGPRERLPLRATPLTLGLSVAALIVVIVGLSVGVTSFVLRPESDVAVSSESTVPEIALAAAAEVPEPISGADFAAPVTSEKVAAADPEPEVDSESEAVPAEDPGEESFSDTAAPSVTPEVAAEKTPEPSEAIALPDPESPVADPAPERPAPEASPEPTPEPPATEAPAQPESSLAAAPREAVKPEAVKPEPPSPEVVVEDRRPIATSLPPRQRVALTPPTLMERPVAAPSSESREPANVHDLPAFSRALQDRYGVSEFKINMVMPETTSNRYAYAIINRLKVYVGDRIGASGVRLAEVVRDGIVVEVSQSGARYFMSF